jgi:hypothetical protein
VAEHGYIYCVVRCYQLHGAVLLGEMKRKIEIKNHIFHYKTSNNTLIPPIPPMYITLYHRYKLWWYTINLSRQILSYWSFSNSGMVHYKRAPIGMVPILSQQLFCKSHRWWSTHTHTIQTHTHSQEFLLTKSFATLMSTRHNLIKLSNSGDNHVHSTQMIFLFLILLI